MKVENGCNAVNVTILLWAAILTYPAPWLQKFKGWPSGSLALHAVNLLRIISLYYLGQYSRDWFDFAHFYLGEPDRARHAGDLLAVGGVGAQIGAGSRMPRPA